MKRFCFIILIVFLSGCASISPYLTRQQELHDGEAVILSRLLDSTPLSNFEAVREIAFRHNPDINILALEIISYHKNLGSLGSVPVSSGIRFMNGDYISSTLDVFGYVSDLIKRANPEKDERLKVMIARFEKAKLEVSQRIAEELTALEELNHEVITLESLAKDSSIEKRISSFFEKRGFTVSEKESKDLKEDSKKELKKKLAEREKVVRSIFELCGLVKLTGAYHD